MILNDLNRFTPSGLSKYNIKVFDIEVDVIDEKASNIITQINEIAKLEHTTQDSINQKDLQAWYIAKAIIDKQQQINLIDCLYNQLNSRNPEVLTSNSNSLPNITENVLKRAGITETMITQYDPIKSIMKRKPIIKQDESISIGRKMIKAQVKHEMSYFKQPHQRMTPENIRDYNFNSFESEDNTNQQNNNNHNMIENESKTNDFLFSTSIKHPSNEDIKYHSVLYSAIHSCRNFLDINNDSLFSFNKLAVPMNSINMAMNVDESLSMNE